MMNLSFILLSTFLTFWTSSAFFIFDFSVKSPSVFQLQYNIRKNPKGSWINQGTQLHATVPVTVYLPKQIEDANDMKEGDLLSFVEDPITLDFDTEETVLENLQNNFNEGKLGKEPPFSCGVGLCTECAALVVQGQSNIELEAAVLDEETTKKGFILTCSSKVNGEGVKLILGQHEKMYDSQYGNFVKDHASFQESGEKSESGRGGGIMDAMNAVLNLNVEA